MDDLEQAEALRDQIGGLKNALRLCEVRSIAGRYAGAAIHEINNPLEALANLIFITQHQSENPEQVRTNMEMADKLVAQMSHITRQALGFYREKGEARRVDLVDIVRLGLKMHSTRVATQHVAVSLAAEEPAYVEGVPTEILQVLSNLILNALDAIPDQAGRLIIRVKRIGVHIYITVADNGCGIDPEIRKHLFTPHNTSKRSGTGMGLWLSQEILSRHHGSITSRSSTRHGCSGTVFRIEFPASSLGDLGNAA